ncbi:MAG: gamma-glutamyl-gamma-aminobutyrate hydrolase family protein, partial [Betaproteobacteria bacterium]
MTSPLKIGISVCLMPPDPDRSTAASKTLQYVEQSNAEWVQKGGALPVLIPAWAESSIDNGEYVERYAAMLDGLVLHGGADVWPGH